jgi:hypothetical protein
VSALRVVAYAINGRGMGHLVRQLAIMRWIRRLAAVCDVRVECFVLTSSEADTLARREQIPAFKMPSKAMLRDAGLEPSRYLALARGWVLNTVAGLAPDLLLVDTFPGGSFGELIAALELARHRVLVARRVKESFAADDPYRALLPLYERHIVPDERGVGPILIREREELLARDEARRALGIAAGRRAVYLTLGGGGDLSAPATLPALAARLRERGWHVVVAAGPLYQGPELRGEGISWIDRYCPLELFAGLDAAVSAGGYNAFHELMFAGVPTVFLPQPRVADDQRERAEAAVAAGAGRIAARLEEVAELLEAPGDAERARALVPHNGARAAAIAALATVLPPGDLALASEVLTPKLLAQLNSAAAPSQKMLEVIRVVGGESPSQQARRRALLEELRDQGVEIAEPNAAPAGAGARVERFLDLVRRLSVPIDAALALTRALKKKFPAASSADLVDACDVLFSAWARFDDWMGAVSLLRAVPVQRGYEIGRFAAAMAEWLGGEDDLFDALRAFAHLERSGGRTVPEVLHILASDKSAAQRPEAAQ